MSLSGMGVLLLISIGIATFFVSLHADSAESILILYLMEEEFIRHRRGKGLIIHDEIAAAVSEYIK